MRGRRRCALPGFEDPRVFAGLDRAYLAGAYRLDPFYEMHLHRAGEGAYRLRDVAPDAFHRSRYFVEYYEETTLIDEIAFVVWPHAGGVAEPVAGAGCGVGQAVHCGRGRGLPAAGPGGGGACARRSGATSGRGQGRWRIRRRLLAAAARARHGIALSPRQAEVALLILRGHSSVSIGLRLGLSPQTVKVFRKQLYRRCAISSQAELFALMLPLLREA